MNCRVTVVAFALAVSVAAPLAPAGLILDEFTITSTGLRMKMSGEMPANIYGSSTQIRISADDQRDMISADDWFLDNSPGMSFDVTNGSGGSNVSRIDSQAGNNQVILFFDNGGFGEGGVVSGMIDFVLPGGSTWDIGAETTFTIKSTISSGLGTILFSGVDQSASTSTPMPGPMALAAFAGIAAVRRRRR